MLREPDRLLTMKQERKEKGERLQPARYTNNFFGLSCGKGASIFEWCVKEVWFVGRVSDAKVDDSYSSKPFPKLGKGSPDLKGGSIRKGAGEWGEYCNKIAPAASTWGKQDHVKITSGEKELEPVEENRQTLSRSMGAVIRFI